jgi:hypothetical protein
MAGIDLGDLGVCGLRHAPLGVRRDHADAMMPTLIAGTGLGILPESPAKICGTDSACEGCFSFGNGCQAIEIPRACFGHFFQKRIEIIG